MTTSRNNFWRVRAACIIVIAVMAPLVTATAVASTATVTTAQPSSHATQAVSGTRATEVRAKRLYFNIGRARSLKDHRKKPIARLVVAMSGDGKLVRACIKKVRRDHRIKRGSHEISFHARSAGARANKSVNKRCGYWRHGGDNHFWIWFGFKAQTRGEMRWTKHVGMYEYHRPNWRPAGDTDMQQSTTVLAVVAGPNKQLSRDGFVLIS